MDVGARYLLFDELGAGGSARVHLGQLVAAGGFRRIVAVKRLRQELADDRAHTLMLLDEARLVASIRHINVVSMHEVLDTPEGLVVVLDYVAGESLASLLHTLVSRGERIPLPIAVAVGLDLLRGLHAAHDARDPSGAPLDIVHRDVSPQNVIVGADGIARVLDFGIAKAAVRAYVTKEVGAVRGKVGYLAPEQLTGESSRCTDIYAASVVLWEMLAGKRLFRVPNVSALRAQIGRPIAPPSAFAPGISPELDAIVLRGLHRDPRERYETARAMVRELEARVPTAKPAEVARFLREHASERLDKWAGIVSAVEAGRAKPIYHLAPSRTTEARFTATLKVVDAGSDAPSDALRAIEAQDAGAPSSATPRRPAFWVGAAAACACVGLFVAVGVAWSGARASRNIDVETPAAAPAGDPAPLAADDSDDVAPWSADVPQTRVAASDGRPPRANPAARTSRKAARACDPPFTWSADGRRKIAKRECFR